MRLFFDECMPPPLARAMAALSAKIRVGGEPIPIVHQREHYGEQETPDLVWIPKLASEGDWIVVSGDTRIRTSPKEKVAWLDSGLTIFFMGKDFPRADEWDQALWLIRCWKKIMEAATRTPTGAGFIVHHNGKLEPVRMEELHAQLPRDRLRSTQRQRDDDAKRGA